VSLPNPIHERPHEFWYRLGFGIGTAGLFLLFALLPVHYLQPQKKSEK